MRGLRRLRRLGLGIGGDARLSSRSRQRWEESEEPRITGLRRKLAKADAPAFQEFVRRDGAGEAEGWGQRNGTGAAPVTVVRTSTDDGVSQGEMKAAAAASEASAAALTDTFGRFHDYLRISLTEKCNLRCVYCMPEEGVPLSPSGSLLTTEEILRLAQLFATAGVRKVRLTGGEPTVRRDLPDIIAGMAAIEPRLATIGITTNGIKLSKARLEDLRAAGLTHLNVSLDTLDADKYVKITRRKGLHRVLQAVEDASTMGFTSVKINCVVMRGVNDEELADFVRLCRDLPVDMRFIEWMPFAANGWNSSTFVSYQEMQDLIAAEYSLPLQPDRSAFNPSDTTKWFRAEGHRGRVGFITSMTEHFCGTCSRLRITADGRLKVCLFGDETLSLRDEMRAGASSDALFQHIGAAVQGKHFKLGGHKDSEEIAKGENRAMILIGG